MVVHIRGTEDRGSIHQPDTNLTIVVMPKNVGLPVAVEIACLFDVPCRSGIGADIGGSNRRGAVHQPDAKRPIGVLPQDVGLTVAIELARGFDLP